MTLQAEIQSQDLTRLIRRVRHTLEHDHHPASTRHLISDLHDAAVRSLLSREETKIRRVFRHDSPNLTFAALMHNITAKPERMRDDVFQTLNDLFLEARLLGTPISRERLEACQLTPDDLPMLGATPQSTWMDLPVSMTRQLDPLGFNKVTAHLQHGTELLTVAVAFRDAELYGLVWNGQRTNDSLPEVSQEAGDYFEVLMQFPALATPLHVLPPRQGPQRDWN